MGDLSPQEFKVELIKALKNMRVYALSLTRDKDLADDITQAAVVRALENYDKFQPGTNMNAWLTTIIKRLFLDDKKSHRVSRTELVGENEEFDVADSGNEQIDKKRVEEISEFVDKSLSERDRSVFLMWVEGLKTDEIADLLDLGRSNVGVILCRARKLIYERFG